MYSDIGFSVIKCLSCVNKIISFRPEALGVVTGCVFLITLFIFIPVPFSQSMLKNADFPHDEVCLRRTYIIIVMEAYSCIKLPP